MKNFDNLYQLWDYCSACPTCKSWKREIDLSLGPEYSVRVNKWFKLGSKLFINFKIKTDNHYFSSLDIQADIDCIDNTFTLDSKLKENYVDNIIDFSHFTGIDKFYIYLYSKCLDCCKSSLNSLDIILDMENKRLSPVNIGIEDETISLRKYRLVLDHNNDYLNIYNLNLRVSPNAVSHNTSRHRPVRCPLFNLDFSDLEKLETKIQTLLTFS